jgi:hypothetical protein
MSRKRRLKKVEKQLAGLIKSVSRLERGRRKPSHRGTELPARRASSAKARDTVKPGTGRQAAGRRATTARGATSKRAPRPPKAPGKRARRSGGAALSALPS